MYCYYFSVLYLGFGGVFNSSEANTYWERRFGRGFFTNLTSIQKNINSQAKLNKARLGTEAPIPDVIEIQDSAVENAIEDLTHSTGDLTGPLFRADTQ